MWSCRCLVAGEGTRTLVARLGRWGRCDRTSAGGRSSSRRRQWWAPSPRAGPGSRSRPALPGSPGRQGPRRTRRTGAGSRRPDELARARSGRRWWPSDPSWSTGARRPTPLPSRHGLASTCCTPGAGTVDRCSCSSWIQRVRPSQVPSSCRLPLRRASNPRHHRQQGWPSARARQEGWIGCAPGRRWAIRLGRDCDAAVTWSLGSRR